VLHDFSFLLLLCVNNNQRPSSTIHFHVECGSGVVVCCWPNRIKVLLPSSIVPEISIIFFSFKQQNSDGDDMGVALANDSTGPGCCGIERAIIVLLPSTRPQIYSTQE
jgi:hypothetical protein